MDLLDEFDAVCILAKDFPFDISSEEWKTKDGTIIKLTDMTESHILNCMRIVGRKDPWHDRFERELRRREFERITNGETFNACYFYPDNESGMGGLRCSHCNELWFPENDVSRFDFCPKCGYKRMI